MDLNLQDPWTAGIVAVLALVVIGLLLRLLGMAVKAVILVVLIAAAAGAYYFYSTGTGPWA